MTYIPGHSSVIAYAIETAAIVESADGETPAVLPAIPASPVLIGYTNVPEATRELGNAKGFAIGSPYPLYNKKGVRKPSLSFEMRIGSIPLLQKCLLGSGGLHDLADLCFFIGVVGQPTQVYRFAKCDTLTLNLQEGDAQELTASGQFPAQCVQVGPTLSPTRAQLSAIGKPLMWHDVRTLTIGGDEYRRSLMGARIAVAHGLERKSPRPYWGDDVPLSLTHSELLPHLNTVTGELSLHNQLSEDLFTGSVNAQEWGDIPIAITDGPGLPAGATARVFDLTLQNVIPGTITQRGVDTSAQMQHSATFLADDLLIATSR